MINITSQGFPGGSAGKEYDCNVRDLGSIPGLGRSPGEGNSYPLQYSGLENSMYGVAKNWTQLPDFHFHFFHLCLGGKSNLCVERNVLRWKFLDFERDEEQ